MDTVYDHIDVSTILETAAVTPTDHGLTMLLIDSDEVPRDQRYRLTTKEGYATELDSSLTPYDWAAVYFGQKRNPSQLMLGRWVSSAEPYQFICGDYETSYAVWELVSDGSFSITVPGIAAGATTDVTGIDFDGDASMADVVATLNTALHAAATGAYADFDFAIDALDRLYIYNPDDATGASSPTITLAAVGSGTDLTSTTYMDVAGGTAVVGMAAETPVAALAAIRAVYDGFYMIAERGLSTAQQVTFSTTVNSLRKMCCFLTADTHAPDAAEVDDIGYLVKALTHKRTICIYDETVANHGDAAFIGCNLPALEGSVDWAWQQLSGVTASVSAGVTETTQKTALDDKNYVRFEYVDPVTYAPYALTAGNEEIRIMIGRDWFNDRITVDIFNAKINNDVFGYNTTSFGIIEGIIRSAGREAIRREIGVDTQARPFTITMPDPDDFTSTQRASHSATMAKIFKLYLNSALWDLAITGVWSY